MTNNTQQPCKECGKTHPWLSCQQLPTTGASTNTQQLPAKSPIDPLHFLYWLAGYHNEVGEEIRLSEGRFCFCSEGEEPDPITSPGIIQLYFLQYPDRATEYATQLHYEQQENDKLKTLLVKAADVIVDLLSGKATDNARKVLSAILDVDNEALSAGEGNNGVLKVGLKFRSKIAPLCSYEVVKIFPETKEFKVKETRECQVSGTVCHEIWSIEGFEKYYNQGVYYIQKEEKQ